MITFLKLKNLGPAPALEIHFSPRLNVITGDNGLGKTLLLDMAWYGLTRTWPEDRMALPNAAAKGEAVIECAIKGVTAGDKPISATYDVKRQDWRISKGKKTKPGLVIYARIDGGFSIWDPARNYSSETDTGSNPHAGKSLSLNRSEVWEGASPCLGLLLDWESWRLSNNGAWKLFKEVLEALSPEYGEQIHPLPAERLLISDDKPTPYLQMPYGKVPVTQCSAGMRRILAMAYMLVWTWLRHKEDAKLIGEKQANSLVLLWDEVEAHLHPQWQRQILPAQMEVVSSILLGKGKSNVQVIVTTHAPLVLASMETHWQERQDKLFNLEYAKNRKQVVVEEVIYAKFGDASGWLASPAFDMDSGYSSEAENAMMAADYLMAGPTYASRLPDGLTDVDSINAELMRTLDGGNRYWPLWLPFYRRMKGIKK